MPADVWTLRRGPGGRLYASGRNIVGVYLSTDNGASWNPIGGWTSYLSALEIGTDGTLFATVSYDGTYRSKDGGNTWARVGPGNSYGYRAAAVSADGGTLVRSDDTTLASYTFPVPTRVAGPDRFSTAAEIARAGWDSARTKAWAGIDEVILASGEDAASADPLSASGLSGVYNAPIFLTRKLSVPTDTKSAIAEIASASAGPVTLHIVGGPGSVPDARFAEISAYVKLKTGKTILKDRVLATGTRYDLAAAVARRMIASTGVTPTVALVANGADATTFFDALSLSPIAAKMHYPILLVSKAGVPTPTQKQLHDIAPSQIIVAGGPANVLTSTVSAVNGTRWGGSTRASTANIVAENAIANLWLTPAYTGVAAKLPDALTGGAAVGKMGGVLLASDSVALPSETDAFLTTHSLEVNTLWVFGGTASVTPGVASAIAAKLK